LARPLHLVLLLPTCLSAQLLGDPHYGIWTAYARPQYQLLIADEAVYDEHAMSFPGVAGPPTRAVLSAASAGQTFGYLSCAGRLQLRHSWTGLTISGISGEQVFRSSVDPWGSSAASSVTYEQERSSTHSVSGSWWIVPVRSPGSSVGRLSGVSVHVDLRKTRAAQWDTLRVRNADGTPADDSITGLSAESSDWSCLGVEVRLGHRFTTRSSLVVRAFYRIDDGTAEQSRDGEAETWPCASRGGCVSITRNMQSLSYGGALGVVRLVKGTSCAGVALGGSFASEGEYSPWLAVDGGSTEERLWMELSRHSQLNLELFGGRRGSAGALTWYYGGSLVASAEDAGEEDPDDLDRMYSVQCTVPVLLQLGSDRFLLYTSVLTSCTCERYEYSHGSPSQRVSNRLDLWATVYPVVFRWTPWERIAVTCLPSFRTDGLYAFRIQLLWFSR
jgi:hypothetical protein